MIVSPDKDFECVFTLLRQDKKVKNVSDETVSRHLNVRRLEKNIAFPVLLSSDINLKSKALNYLTPPLWRLCKNEDKQVEA
jgi:hypothetical protein